MQERLRKILQFGLLITIFLAMPSGPAAAEESQEKPSATAENKIHAAVLRLADLIPREAELSIRLVKLKNKLTAITALSAVENRLPAIEENLEENTAKFKQMADSASITDAPLIELSQDLKLRRQELDRAAKPVSDAIQKLDNLHSQWLHENRSWQNIKSGHDFKDLPHGIETTLDKGLATISKALELIRQAMQPMLILQAKTAELHVRTETMAAKVNHRIQTGLGAEQVDTYPPLISSEFLSQLKDAWRYQKQIGLSRVAWRNSALLGQQGWIIILQAVVALALIFGIYRKRKMLARTERLLFLTKRPISAGVFIASESFHAFYTVGPTWMKLLLTLVAGISFLRLTRGICDKSWQRQALAGLVFFLIGVRVLSAIAAPLPILRLFVVVTSVAGIFYCLQWAVATRREGEKIHVTAGLQLGAGVLAVVLAAQLWGKAIGVQYLIFMPAITIALTLAWWLLMRIARGLLEWVVRRSDWQLPEFVRQDPETAIRRTAAFGNAVFGIAYLCVALVIWEVYPDPFIALDGLLRLGFTIGTARISVGLVVKAALMAYGAFVVAWAIKRLILKKEYDRRDVDPGVRFSINRLITLAFVFVGFLMALGVLGFRLTHLTIIISALGVGIGFGLQGVFNNFICGLILLFEQPIRVGDAIEFQGQWAEVKEIGLRSTRIRSYDSADVIVPNNDLISGQVTNWTLSSRMVRIRIPVGVAYGSDVPLVIESLLACAKDHTGVAARPEPKVLFLKFGDSALDFELRVWIANFDDSLRVQSEMHQQIDEQFRAAGIEIAFPQRDLHLRSIDQAVQAGIAKTEK